MNVWEGEDPFAEARRFSELWSVDGPVLVDARGELVDLLGVRGVPTNILVDEDGTVVEFGAPTPAALEAAVLRLLGPGATLAPAVEAGGWHWQQEPDHIEEHIAQWHRYRDDGAATADPAASRPGPGSAPIDP